MVVDDDAAALADGQLGAARKLVVGADAGRVHDQVGFERGAVGEGHTVAALAAGDDFLRALPGMDVDAECLFVLDFSVLKRIVRSLADEIDHKVLLPTENPKLAFRTDGEMLHVDYFGKPTYVFPRSDCALLPIQNSTAEMLAQYLARRLRDELAQEGHTHLTLLELEVEESFGQSATYRTSLVPD